jgi:CMP/dCMP kinase
VVVAVDGPSGSGKSTVSREVARRLGLEYLDTGAMYRAVCWWCLDRGIDLGDTDAVADAARHLSLEMGTAPTDPRVEVDGQDIAVAIRTTRISTAVSAVATNLGVRAELQQRQREIISESLVPPRRGCVAEGRDITTVVAPDADVRVLLTADASARLARRTAELHGTVDADAVAATRDQVLRRDAQDSTVSSFRAAAAGVHTIDSSSMGLEEVVVAVLALVGAADNTTRGEHP